ncbi:Cytosolic Fe-S cluster assembly factor NARFL [Porphyridium purpureum]|uniref:Cytosolic Fe-S cluster assembly factor NARFL n=1 Tax=Porphyridium purpureum TaxID=35688 RepID=A0A5J4Z4L9_PORPP|nr:Cytosolic Fe-S cluster assembly factor NARFL [Porphyridium purpureum]|eukprot:POR9739..scf295_1
MAMDRAHAASARLQVSDLNDLLTPSPSCVLQLVPASGAENGTGSGSGSAPVPVPGSFAAPMFPTLSSQPSGDASQKVARIQLSDCLSCSGCVTSAETILLDRQSTAAFLELVDGSSKRAGLSCVALSHQSVASFAAAYNVSLESAAKKLCWFLKHSIGVTHVVHLSLARAVSLELHAQELLERMASGNSASLPMMSGSCPGFTVYAEKTLEMDILQRIAHAVSPQAVLGGLIAKNGLLAKADASASRAPRISAGTLMQNKNNVEIACCTVMPCADKKLEAVRREFAQTPPPGGGGSKSFVDLVLTSSELDELVSERLAESSTATFKALPECELDSLCGEAPVAYFAGRSQSPSGGLLEYVLRAAAERLFGIGDLHDELESDPRIETREVRNHDMREIRVRDTPLCFAYVYGFRNIQNLMRRIRMGRCAYQFVEVMSCPSGCVNGGGQIIREERSERKASVELTRLRYEEAAEQRQCADVSAPVALQTLNELHAIPENDSKWMQLTLRPLEKTLGSELAW